MINRLRIILEQPEYSALIKLSGQEVRSPADQVVVIVRNELVRRDCCRQTSCHMDQT